MNHKKLPASLGTYRVIRQSELTPEQQDVLRKASTKHVLERLCALIGEGQVSVSQAQAKYGALMKLVGKA